MTDAQRRVVESDPQRASMSLAEIESRQRVSDGLIRDHDADADIGAGPVYVMPDGLVAERTGVPMRRLACGCVPRFTLVEACAAVAERIEHEALGSPIAQDTARRIRLAILALR